MLGQETLQRRRLVHCPRAAGFAPEGAWPREPRAERAANPRASARPTHGAPLPVLRLEPLFRPWGSVGAAPESSLANVSLPLGLDSSRPEEAGRTKEKAQSDRVVCVCVSSDLYVTSGDDSSASLSASPARNIDGRGRCWTEAAERSLSPPLRPSQVSLKGRAFACARTGCLRAHALSKASLAFRALLDDREVALPGSRPRRRFQKP